MELTTQQRSFLNGVHFAVAATLTAEGRPHQTVVWYQLEGDQVLVSTPRDSLKHKHLRRDPRLSLCIEQAYRYVTLAGSVTLEEDPAAARADYERLGKRYRRTFNPLLIVGFMGRAFVSRVRARLQPAAAPARANRMQDLLARERVTVRMQIEKIQSSGFD